jgi:DNA-binding CsgD family transcriptional regulator
LPADAVALLLEAAHDDAPAGRLLGFLGRLAPVDYLSLIEYLPDRRCGMSAPELLEGHARAGIANVTPDCFVHYRRHFWREDQGTRIAHRVEAGGSAGMAAMHVEAHDIPVDSWRREIYDQARLADRLSFYYRGETGHAYSLNLYRLREHGSFGRAEIERLLAVAPLLRQAHHAAHGRARGGDRTEVVARAERALQRKAPELSAREAAVCARIACGLSLDGIAADLSVAPSTVATLRKRAYAKLAARHVLGGRLQLAAFVR